MNGLVLESVGWALLHLVWQGALVAAALALALRWVGRRSANLRYALACGALGIMLALPMATAWRHASRAQQVRPVRTVSVPRTVTPFVATVAIARTEQVARAPVTGTASLPPMEGMLQQVGNTCPGWCSHGGWGWRPRRCGS